MRSRQIIRSSSTSNAEIRELLQGIFTAELLCPSKQLWLVSPWLSDIELLLSLIHISEPTDQRGSRMPSSA